MRLIDADKLLELFPPPAEPWEMRGQQYLFHVREIREIINDTPTVDAVPVVRCKDCIYFDKYSDGIEKYQWDGFCACWARNTYENWYCSRGERRTD